MDIRKFVKLNDKGEIEFDESGFQSSLDSEISRAVDKYANGKGKDEIRKKLEEEAKLSAEEKLKAEKEEFEKYKLQTKIEINQAKAKAKLENKGFTEKEVEFLLSTVNDDEEKSLSNIDVLVEERTKFISDTQKNAIEKLQQQQQSSGSKPLPTPDNNDAPKAATRTKADILNHYRPKQN